MRAVGGGLVIAAGTFFLFVVTQGFTKNLNAAWNTLIGASPTGGLSLGQLSAIANTQPVQTGTGPISVPSYFQSGWNAPTLNVLDPQVN